jgi:hypothetical protein
MKKILPIVIFSFVFFLAGYSINSFQLSNKKIISLDKYWISWEYPYSDNVVCTLKISAVTKLEGYDIYGEINIDEKPITLTFIDLNNENPGMIGNLGDRGNLVKIDNGSFIYLIEETEVWNLNIFTLFRDKNVMILSKQYDIFGKPFGMIMMGDCLSGT